MLRGDYPSQDMENKKKREHSRMGRQINREQESNIYPRTNLKLNCSSWRRNSTHVLQGRAGWRAILYEGMREIPGPVLQGRA